jgi:hypothetical protein
MHEIIEHELVVDLIGEKINLEDACPGGIHGSCNTKDTVFACGMSCMFDQPLNL